MMDIAVLDDLLAVACGDDGLFVFRIYREKSEVGYMMPPPPPSK